MTHAHGTSAEYDWTELDVPEENVGHWAHPGAGVGADGSLYVAGHNGHTVHRYLPDGSVESFELGTVECHGLTVDAEGGVWVADPGAKNRLVDGEVVPTNGPGQAVYVVPGQGIVKRLEPQDPGWSPTGMALHDFGRGSDGRVWVADGYGIQVVHCYDKDGELLWTSDGTDSGTRFSYPHGITIDDRGDTVRVLVADRGNKRIVILDVDGHYQGEFGADILDSPSGLAIGGDTLWVSELLGRIVGFDADDQLVEIIGQNSPQVEAWPNRKEGDKVAPPDIVAGAFNSPHGIAALPTGEILVAEWFVGGRVTVLRPV